MPHSRRIRLSPACAFTLVELLVVIGIIGVLAALLLPSLAGARRAANTVQCSSNMRQICAALIGYAAENRGKFPLNVSKGSLYWYDPDRIGQWIPVTRDNLTGGGGVLVCPEETGTWRSYAMNMWASSMVDSTAIPKTYTRTLWSPYMPRSSQMILLTEAWTTTGSASLGDWRAPATIGNRSQNSGQLFGGNGGVTLFSASPWGKVNCELAYNRHRNGKGNGTEPIGRLNMGYADGHVELRSNDQLVDSATGLSTFDSFWSSMDFQYP